MKNLSLSRLEKISKIEDEINKAQATLIFDLYVSDDESFFKVRDFLPKKENAFIEMSIGLEAIGVFYNSSHERLRQLNAYGENFLVSKSKYNWVLKNIKKKIGKYSCNKAVLIEKVKTRKGIRDYGFSLR